jgi:glycosyltransferase involved in cell wall biosynthesis
MSPRIAIDITPLLYTGNGIHRCTAALVKRLAHLDCGIEFMMVGRRLGGRRVDRQTFDAPVVRLRLPRKAEPLIRAMGLIEQTCRAELYHATDFYMPLRRPERAVATVHDLIFLKDPESMVDHVRLRRWAGDFARRCRAILTTSEWSKRDIVTMLGVDPDKVHVVYWGVDQETFPPPDDPAAVRERLRSGLGICRPYFLAVSCSMERKNTPRLLRAFERLLKSGTEHDLVVVWEPPAELRQQHQQREQQGRIRFTGRVADSTLRDLYAGATAMIFPSLEEGFGLPVLEAMSCGTPVVTSNASCLPEIGGEAALYVDPLDERAITSAMATVESDARVAETCRQRGLVRAAAFTWERCARQTLDVYRAALAG